MSRKFFVSVILSALILGYVLPAFAIGDKEREILNSVLGSVLNEAAKNRKTPKNSGGTQSNIPPARAPEPTSFSQKHEDALLSIGLRIQIDLQELGNNILNYNKPALEVKLTKQERLTPELDDYDNDVRPTPSPIMYSRVCVKGKTVVVGSAEKNKKFTADFIITGDPDFPPKSKEVADNPSLTNFNGIYVGADIRVIENFVGMSAQNITRIQQQETGVINLDPTSFVFTNLAYKDGKITELHHSNGYALNSKKAWSFAQKKAKELGLTFANQIAGE